MNRSTNLNNREGKNNVSAQNISQINSNKNLILRVNDTCSGFSPVQQMNTDLNLSTPITNDEYDHFMNDSERFKVQQKGDPSLKQC